MTLVWGIVEVTHREHSRPYASRETVHLAVSIYRYFKLTISAFPKHDHRCKH
jgi:hypothetical protein